MPGPRLSWGYPAVGRALGASFARRRARLLLKRHRFEGSVPIALLLQPDCFEGVAALAEHTHLHDPPLVDVDGEIAALINSRLTLKAAGPLVDRHEHQLPSRVANLVHIEMPIPPRARPALQERQDLSASV